MYSYMMTALVYYTELLGHMEPMYGTNMEDKNRKARPRSTFPFQTNRECP